jgi:hypothetical protein
MGGQGHAPAALTPRTVPGTPCTEGWLGPTAGLDGCGISRPYRDSYVRQFPLHVISAVLSDTPPVSSMSVLMSLAVILTRSAVSLNTLVAAVVSNEPTTLQVLKLRAKRKPCQHDDNQTPADWKTAKAPNIVYSY